MWSQNNTLGTLNEDGVFELILPAIKVTCLLRR